MDIKNLKTDQLEKASQMLKAMAHPIRVSIMHILENDKLNVTQIYEKLDLEQSVVSHHLGILRDKGVLNGERDGKKVYYSLKHKLLSSIIGCVSNCID
ncbi:MAG: metalloregulator ArsR/SmtB family transcription factor [Bacteroidota bacterium]|nr:metalloregulator ArsR/SmtB family transcription factor [Bacteroidota bacterium]